MAIGNSLGRNAYPARDGSAPLMRTSVSRQGVIRACNETWLRSVTQIMKETPEMTHAGKVEGSQMDDTGVALCVTAQPLGHLAL